jgi:hypothetical protein
MKKIRILYIEFENDIASYEISAFRSAVVQIAGNENIIFHNHLKKSFRYSYPLIQYKQINKHPVIICIDEGVEEIHHFFEKKQIGIILGKREYELKILKLNLNQFIMQVWDKTFYYHLRNWLPLNQKNYSEFKKIDNEIEQIEYLEKILTGNILSFARGIEWEIDKKIQLRINKINDKKIITVKKVKREAYTIDFSTNVFIPNHIGLGKNASVGFGIVKQIKNAANARIKNE